MIKFVAVLAIALSTPAIAADAPQTYAFDAEGHSFDVVRTDTAKGTVLSGKDSNGKRFRLHVAGNLVTGRYAGTPIRFAIPAPIAPSQVAALD